MTADDFAAVLAEALRRMAAEEQGKADGIRAACLLPGPYRLLGLEAFLDRLAREPEARAQLYREWALALSFPGGPVDVDWIRYGTRRDWR